MMNCSACGAPLGPDDAFCSACGHAVVRPQAPVTTAGQPTEQQPTVPIPPSQPAQPATSPNPAAHQDTWQPTQHMPRVDTPPTYPAPAGAATPTGQPRPGSYAPQGGYPASGPQRPQGVSRAVPSKGLGAPAIIGIILAGLALVGLAAALVILLVMPRFRTAEPAVTQPEPIEEPAPVEQAAPEVPEGVFAESLEAARAEVPEDYVIELAEETADRKVYWAGPPNSEWDAVIVVDRVEQGWKVTETTPFNGSAPSEDSGPEGEADSAAAEDVVSTFLTAIKNDKPSDAQRLTVTPFREDPASAQYADGQFKKFTIDRTEAEDDGTFWVYTTQTWSFGVEKWRYDVVPTEAGLRIRNVEYVE